MPDTPDTQRILQRGGELLIGNYARQPLAMARGQGAEVWDTAGKRYVDLFAGFGGAVLGHCHPALVEAATRQAQKLWHVGNTFYSEPQIEFAERLAKTSFGGQAFFCHSGLEANEAAVKLARLRHKDATPKRFKVISLHKSFHGRSLAMISATGNPKIKAGFEPLVPGFIQVEPGDIAALEAAVDPETAAIIMEPIQGEGGVNLYPADYAAKVRELCDRRQLTLIFDEVWTGGGRTGKWFAHQFFTKGSGFRVQGSALPESASPEPRTLNPENSIVEPDIMTLGKAMGGGLPVGVMWAKPQLAKLMVPSTHGSTLGANMICMAVARTIFDVIEREGWLDNARQLGEHAMARLRNDPKLKSKVAEVRGRGLMLGIELKDAPDKIVEKGLERGVILNLTATKVIRLAPPINISKALWDEGLERVVDAIAAG